jgi:DNA-binding response OmpR family regulator
VRTTFGLIRRKLPILVISGLGEQEVVDYVMDIGASGYLHKPIDPDILLSMVREYAVD